jgi:hypothetical protein
VLRSNVAAQIDMRLQCDRANMAVRARSYIVTADIRLVFLNRYRNGLGPPRRNRRSSEQCGATYWPMQSSSVRIKRVIGSRGTPGTGAIANVSPSPTDQRLQFLWAGTATRLVAPIPVPLRRPCRSSAACGLGEHTHSMRFAAPNHRSACLVH